LTDKWSLDHSTSNPAQFVFKTVEGDARRDMASLDFGYVALRMKLVDPCPKKETETYLIGLPVSNNVARNVLKDLRKDLPIQMSPLPQEPFCLLRDRVSNELIFLSTCLVGVGKRCRLHEIGMLV
jgi:hypothetical protein